MRELPHPLGPTQVLEAMGTEIEQADLLRQAVDHQCRGRFRHQDLPTVSDRPKASAADHRLSEVVPLVSQLRLAGVDGHTDAQADAVGPRLPGQSALRVDRGRNGVRGAGEGADDAVAFTLLDRPDAGVGRDGLVQEGIVAWDGLGHPTGRCLPASRAALDVGQQERDGSRR